MAESTKTIVPTKKVVYDNCVIYAPDGKLIGYTTRRRMNRYISKGIADQVDDNIIKLKFEPNYIGENSRRSAWRKNICYACGVMENLVKYHVIPIKYKQLFPQKWKSHNASDILSLCKDCSIEASSHKYALIDRMSEEYGISDKDFIDQKILKLKNLCNKIIGKEYHVGAHGLRDLYEAASKIAGRDITDADVAVYAVSNAHIEFKGVKSVGEYIVKKVIEDDKIYEFIKRWKDNFVENMQPIELPEDFYEFK